MAIKAKTKRLLERAHRWPILLTHFLFVAYINIL
nr:MAG TPA: hypothetical protein [Caudoviricetes sp.]